MTKDEAEKNYAYALSRLTDAESKLRDAQITINNAVTTIKYWTPLLEDSERELAKFGLIPPEQL